MSRSKHRSRLDCMIDMLTAINSTKTNGLRTRVMGMANLSWRLFIILENTAIKNELIKKSEPPRLSNLRSSKDKRTSYTLKLTEKGKEFIRSYEKTTRLLE